MTSARLVLQSVIVLTACVVGFVMGRWSSTRPATAEVGVLPAGWPTRTEVWDLDATPALGGTLPGRVGDRVDSASGVTQESDDGPDQQFFPGALKPGSGPERFREPETTEPIHRETPAATASQIKTLIEQELPGASAADKKVWLEELQGMPFESVREILQLKQSLGTLKSTDDSPADNPDDPGH
ncbi:MAG: hypothetical protein VX304_04380 [Planctomycetota bacterium]|nr:hypothetical protein [Planctomycetota bacterium]